LSTPERRWVNGNCNARAKWICKRVQLVSDFIVRLIEPELKPSDETDIVVIEKRVDGEGENTPTFEWNSEEDEKEKKELEEEAKTNTELASMLTITQEKIDFMNKEE